MEPNNPSQPSQPVIPVVQNPNPQTPPVTPETQPPVIQPIPSVPSNPPNKTKYILLGLLILLILVALGGGIYYLGAVKQQPTSQKNYNVTKTIAPNSTSTPTPTPTPDPTASWKTYTSSDNSFSIKAPSTWTVDNSFAQANSFDQNVVCLYLDNNSTMVLSACYRHSKLADSIYSGVPTRSTVIKTEINGLVAYNDKGFSLDDFYIINPDGTFILITRDSQLDANLFEKVVSTFKFTQ